jgi:hypothetical protein
MWAHTIEAKRCKSVAGQVGRLPSRGNGFLGANAELKRQPRLLPRRNEYQCFQGSWLGTGNEETLGVRDLDVDFERRYSVAALHFDLDIVVFD